MQHPSPRRTVKNAGPRALCNERIPLRLLQRVYALEVATSRVVARTRLKEVGVGQVSGASERTPSICLWPP